MLAKNFILFATVLSSVSVFAAPAPLFDDVIPIAPIAVRQAEPQIEERQDGVGIVDSRNAEPEARNGAIVGMTRGKRAPEARNGAIVGMTRGKRAPEARNGAIVGMTRGKRAPEARNGAIEGMTRGKRAPEARNGAIVGMTRGKRTTEAA